MKIITWIIIGVIALAAVVGSIYLAQMGSQNQKPASQTLSSGEQIHNVNINNYAFDPSELNVKIGDTVIWANGDYVDHTITSDSGSEILSSSLATLQTYSHTFNTAGTFDYHCSIHPSMKGKIIVK